MLPKLSALLLSPAEKLPGKVISAVPIYGMPKTAYNARCFPPLCKVGPNILQLFLKVLRGKAQCPVAHCLRTCFDTQQNFAPYFLLVENFLSTNLTPDSSSLHLVYKLLMTCLFSVGIIRRWSLWVLEPHTGLIFKSFLTSRSEPYARTDFGTWEKGMKIEKGNSRMWLTMATVKKWIKKWQEST